MTKRGSIFQKKRKMLKKMKVTFGAFGTVFGLIFDFEKF